MVSHCAVVYVEKEEQRGEDTSLGVPVLIVQVLDEIFPSFTCCKCYPLTDGSWYNELGEFRVEDFWDDDVKCRAKVDKQNSSIHPW